MLHDPNDQSGQDLIDEYGALVGEIGERLSDDFDADLVDFADDLRSISAHVSGREQSYATAMREVVAKLCAGELAVEEYRVSAPLDLIFRALREHGSVGLAQALDPTLSEVVRRVNEMCAIGLDLHVSTVRMIAAGKNIEADANTLGDEEICCATSFHSTINQSAVILVTEEGKLRSAALAAGAGDRVMSLSTY